MPVVVSDASVLISLAAVQQLKFLKECYQEIYVPDAVWQEVTLPGLRPGAKETIQAHQEGWLKVQTPRNRALIVTLQTKLDRGEAEAISLSVELAAALLLIDELDGRAEARALGLNVTGTLGVLLRARQSGMLTALKPVLDGLVQQHSFRLARSLYEEVLRHVGETP